MFSIESRLCSTFFVSFLRWGESRRKIKRLTKCLAFLTLLLTPPESLMGKQSNEARFMLRVSDGGPQPSKNFQFCLFCFGIQRLTGAFRFLRRFETQFTLCTSPAFRSSAVLTPPISQRPSLTGVYRGLIIVIVAGKEPLITHHLRVCEFWDFFSYCTSRMWSPSENFLFFPTNPRHPLPSTYPILCNGRSLDWLFNSPTTEIPHSSPLSQCDGDRKLLIRIKIQLRHLFKISHLFGVFSPISG